MLKRTLRAQIEEVEYELGKRRQVYPRLVASRKLRQGEADEHVARMEAALATLRWVEANAADLRRQAMEEEDG